MTRVKRATLTDVARLAGVSVTTASYILNGRTAQMRISDETAAKVRAAITELDYRPNRSAQNLRRASTQTVGVISDFVASGAFASQMLSGASHAARALEHLLVIGETLGDPSTEELMIREMLDRQVDGIVYLTVAASRVTVPPRLRTGPTVLLNCLDPELDLPAVLPDDEHGGRVAAAHLLQRGLGADVWAVGHDLDLGSPAGGDRLRGLAAGLAARGAALSGVVSCEWDVRPAHDAVSAWLAEGNRPAVLVCLNDRIAMGVYQALAEFSLDVPHDVSVLSFDGSELADWMRPRLTSVALPFLAMGMLAVEHLLSPDSATAGVTRLPLAVEVGGSVLGDRQ
ncbi:MAG: LacI family DNA-binding transcriptional regulator [Marmoricola sp.]|nr:LacI family DNA-binding transcriptional regulator [Marmoricola sp.]